ncbi:MAG: helix-turn-helix domain-containing protein [Pseudomonadales bacterium]
MTFWVIPSLMAIVAKLILFWIARNNLTSRLSFTLLLVSLFVMNAVEFSSFYRAAAVQPENYSQYLWMMQLYYLGGVGVIAAILDVALTITLKEATRFRQINGVVAAIVAVLTIVPGSVIAGIEPLGDLVRRVPGPAMAIWSGYIIGASAISFVALIRGIKKASTLLDRRKSCALALAFLPLLISGGLIVLLMSLGYAINGVATMSITTTLLVIILYITDTRYQLYNFLSSVPATAEYKNWQKLRQLSHQLKEAAALPERQQELRAIVQDIESASIAMAIDANDGNMSKTARHIGVSRATVIRKIQAQREREPDLT